MICLSVLPLDIGITEPFGTVMQAESAGKQAVTEGDVDNIVVGHAGRGHEPGNQLGPGIQVVAGVADHGRLAGGAGRGMDADDILERHGEHAVRIVDPQILLGGKRQPGQVVQ